MLNRLKDAARHAKIEQKLKQRLAAANVADGASITLRKVADQLRATVLLAENPTIGGASVKALEADLATIDGLDGVTLVTTAHNPNGSGARSAPPPEPATDARIRRGHDNPLAIPGAKPESNTHPGAAPTLKARPQKQRPGNAGKIIAVASGKGGVGKSTVSAKLALALAAQGARVGLLDLDIYGPSLPVLFDLEGVRPKVADGMVHPLETAGISLMSIGFLVGEEQALAWRGPMVMGAAKQLLYEVRWPELDWIIIDTPPGTGDAHLTLLQRTRIDGAVLVSTPSPLAIADVKRGAALFKKMDVPLLGLVENMATLPDGSRPFGNGLDEAALTSLALNRLVSLPLDPGLAAAPGRATSAPAEAFLTLADKVKSALTHLDPAPTSQ